MIDEKVEIINRVNGAIAEKLFELMHLELGCHVVKTGQEILYPNLFSLAYRMKKVHHSKFITSDIMTLAEGDSMLSKLNMGTLDDSIWRQRSRKKLSQEILESVQDFTIITPAGNICPYEVKFRKNGTLSTSLKKKYIRTGLEPLIFLVSPGKPYIQIFEARRQVSQSIDNAAQKYATDKTNKSGVIRTYVNSYNEYIQKKVKPRYAPLQKLPDDSLLTHAFVPSDRMEYPIDILKKYKKIVKEIFIKK